jgi:predicted dehydrogenase
MARLAIIGCGARLADLMGRIMDLEPGTQLVAVADPDEGGARTRLEEHRVPIDATRFHPDARTLLQDADAFDGIMIGTRCHLHAEIGAQTAATDLPVFLEKPVGITPEQLDALSQAFAGRENRVLVSFPLRFSPLFLRVEEILASGRLGIINQIQAVNNIPYGGVYFATWYRSYEETGGLWLQKATHDVDCINAIARAAPTRVAAMTSKTVFTGDKPYTLRCSACPDTDTCLESPEQLLARGDTGGMAEWSDDPAQMDHWCVFSDGIRHPDAGSALIQYANGIHAVYSQNFVTRRQAARRGAIITGYLGTLEYDFPSNHIRIVDHHRDKTELETIDTGGRAHFGGDVPLLTHFLEMTRGEAVSRLPLSTGLISAATCIAITRSSEDGAFHEVGARGLPA